MVDIDELPNLNQEESDLAALLIAGPNQEGRNHIITETETLLRTIDALRTQLQQAEEERDEVNETLILIRGRELEAISRWRAEDVQRYLTQPDYGELLDWLNAERDAAIHANQQLWAFAQKIGILAVKLQQAEEERDGWKQLADFAVPRMEAAESAVRIGLDLLPKLWTERDRWKDILDNFLCWANSPRPHPNEGMSGYAKATRWVLDRLHLFATERDAAIKRAEAAERELEHLKDEAEDRRWTKA